MTGAPGPAGIELLRSFVARRHDPIGLLADLRRRYGDIVRVRVGDTSQFLISDLAAMKHVLVDNHRNYSKGPGYEHLASILGHGLVTAEGERWRRHRRLVQPALERERMHRFVDVMAREAAREARRFAESAEHGEIVDVSRPLMDLALRIASRTLLGADVEGREHEVHQALTVVLDFIERLSVSPLRVLELLPGGRRLRPVRAWLASRPTARRREFEQAVATLDRVIYDVIAHRRRELARGADSGDLVSLLLSAPDDENAGAMSDLEVRDEVMTMFLAGHETTGTALAWSLHLLAHHPGHARAITAQAAAMLGDREPTLGDLPALDVARQIAEEAMRLYPPVWRISRYALAPDRIGEVDIPAGSVIVISPYLVHHDPVLWPNPEAFDPGRFSADESRARPRLAYLPFGAGARMCLGANFAIAELQVVLTAICRAVRLEPAADVVPRFEPRITLRPQGGMPIRLARAVSAPAGAPA